MRQSGLPWEKLLDAKAVIESSVLMQPITISANNLTKRFGRRTLFKDLTFAVGTGESLAVTGANGVGKSTLVQILALLASPTRGRVEWLPAQIEPRALTGFCSPALRLYGSLTVYENLRFAARGREAAELSAALEEFNLAGHRDKELRHCSSGMQQRLKVLCAMINEPPVLFLDEPCSNLDAAGKELVFAKIKAAQENSIVVLATNEPAEAGLCTRRISLDR